MEYHLAGPARCCFAHEDDNVVVCSEQLTLQFCWGVHLHMQSCIATTEMRDVAPTSRMEDAEGLVSCATASVTTVRIPGIPALIGTAHCMS